MLDYGSKTRMPSACVFFFSILPSTLTEASEPCKRKWTIDLSYGHIRWMRSVNTIGTWCMLPWVFLERLLLVLMGVRPPCRRHCRRQAVHVAQEDQRLLTVHYAIDDPRPRAWGDLRRKEGNPCEDVRMCGCALNEIIGTFHPCLPGLASSTEQIVLFFLLSSRPGLVPRHAS